MVKCGFTNCEEEAIGEAHFPGIDKWSPRCKVHYEILRMRMKVRLLGESAEVE